MAKTISYKPLFKLLIDREMSKTELQKQAGISAATMAKLGHGANVTTNVLLKICTALDCQISDIIDILEQPEA